MKTIFISIVLAMACPFRVNAISFVSPTFDLLSLEAEKDPASLPSAAQAKSEAADGYDGRSVKGARIQTLKPLAYAGERGPAEPPPSKGKETRDSYHFEGRQPVKGINLYTAVKDESGDETTGKPAAAADPFKKYMRISGAAAVVLTAAGVFFPPLLFLGGFAAGVCAVLWFLGRKTKK